MDGLGNSGIYGGFAMVYDIFMDNVPYKEWTSYLVSLLREYGVQGGLVADLGCGTGSVTELLAAAGYDMIGIDNSEEMLSAAMEKHAGSGVLYLCQDMREFELYGTVAAMVSICDSINYLLSEDDLLSTFKLVNNYLEKEGLFIFDLNTEYKYQTLLADNTIAEKREECSFIWENSYDTDTRINEYGLTLFVREEGDLYRCYEETHYQRAYSLETIQRLLAESGMEYLAAYDAFTRNPPTDTSERIYIIAREGRQTGKYYLP